jgi:hypothetical protein
MKRALVAVALLGVVAVARAQERGVPLGLRLAAGSKVELRCESDVTLTRETRVKGGAPTRATLAYRVRQVASVSVLAVPEPHVHDVEVSIASLAVDADEDAVSASFDSAKDDPAKGTSALVEPFAAALRLVARGRLLALPGKTELAKVERVAKDGKRTATEDPRDVSLGKNLLGIARPLPARSARVGETWTLEERRVEEAGELVVRHELRLAGLEPCQGHPAARVESRSTFSVVEPPADATPRKVLELREGEGRETLLVDLATGRVLRSTRRERLVLRSKVVADVEVTETRTARRTLEEAPAR